MGKQNNEYKSKYVYDTTTGSYGQGDASLDTGARRRKISQKDYDTILEALVKSNASDAKLTTYLNGQGLDDADIDLLMADRKKKIQSSDSTSPSKVTGLSLVFPETEKMVAKVKAEDSFLVGDPLKVSQQAIQYDIQQNEQNKKVIQAVSYNSFLEYEELMKDIIGDEKYNNPNEMFELLVDKDEEYQKEVLPYKNAIARVDLQIAEELGVLDAYKTGIEKRTSKRGLEKSWAPFSGMAASRIKLSREQIDAIQSVNNEIQKRGIPMATEYDTDDFVQKASEIRDKYRGRYGGQFTEVFQKNFRGAIPEQYANSPFALKKIEDYMHQMNSSVDLNGDGRVYQRGTALGRGYNQFVLSTFEMAADVANVIADQTDNEEFKKVAGEAKQQIVDKKKQEGTVETQDFSLSDFVTGEGGTVTGLINKTVSLTSQSLPYMMGVGGIQKTATKAGVTLLGSKTLAKYTASTVGMGTISAASAYSNGMGQEWFEDMTPIGKVGYSSVHGLAEGAGETLSFAVFNRMIAPVLKTGPSATRQTFTEFIKGAAKAYGWNVSEEIAAESATALVQTTAEILAKGEEVTWEKINDRVNEAVEGAILMTSGMQGTTTAIRAPFEVQNLHIAKSLGLGDTKLRSRAVITRLSDEYIKETDEKRKGIIGEQLAKALYNESVRNQQNADFFEAIRKQSPEDHAKLLDIADNFQKKVDTWKSMEEGTAKSVLGAEIKEMFQEKLAIEEKYKDITGEAAPVNATPEAASIARKINSGESLTLDEETFYAENQAEVEEAVSNVGIRELYTPFEMNGKMEPTIELTEENRDDTLDDLINNAETVGEDVFKGFKTTREAVIKGLESIKGAMRAIAAINPDAKFYVHTSAEAFKKATGLKKLSRGYYKSGNTVHFLAPAMTSTTGYHESTHAAFMETLGQKSYDKLFGEIVKMMRNSPEGLMVGDAVRNFIEGYSPENRSEEGVTEFISMLAAGQFDVKIEKGILRKIAEVMGSVLPFNVSIPSRTQGAQILKDIAESMKEGSPIDPDKIQKLKARKDKGQEAGDKAQTVLNPRDLEEGDPVYEYLKGLDIVPEDLDWMGSGDFGEAYSDGDGTIVKFTNSNSEFETAQEILAATGGRKKLIDLAFAEIEDAVEIDGNKIIIMEELDTDGAEELFQDLDMMAEEAGVPLSEFWIDTDEVTEVDGDLIEGLDQLDDIFRAYRALGIFAPDVKGDNLGFGKDGRLKAFDIQERGKSQIIKDIVNQRNDIHSPEASSEVKTPTGKAQSIVMESASNIIKSNIIDLKSLVGEKVPMAVFYDNTKVGFSTVKNALDGYTTGNKFDGGFGYSFRENAQFEYNGRMITPVMAFTTEAKAALIIKDITAKEGNLIPLVNQNNLTGHLGNLDTLQELFGNNGHFAHAESKSPKAAKEILSGLKDALERAKTFTGKDKEKTKIAKALQQVNTDGINSVADFKDFVLSGALNSFGLRNKFLQEYVLLKKRGSKPTKSTTPARALAYTQGIPTMEELSEGMTEQAFSNAELGDVVAFIKPSKEAIVYTDLEQYKDGKKGKTKDGFEYDVVYAPDLMKHTSYPFVIAGENVGFPSQYVDVTSLFPDLEGIKKSASYYKAGRRARTAPVGEITDELIQLIKSPDTDPFSQYDRLSSTPEGKAQIIGELGASKSHEMTNKLELARDMENDGKDKEAIFFATGWYRGMDNQWRSEIRYGHVKKAFFDTLGTLGKAGIKGIDFRLGGVFDSPALYEMYPHIANYAFTIEEMSPITMGYHQRSYKDSAGNYTGKIAVNLRTYFEEVDGKFRPKKGKSFSSLMNTIYHEVQHAVQSAEGVTDGYNEIRVSGDVWYSKKRSLNTAKTQMKLTNLLFKEMMEIGEEQMLKNHRLLAYVGTALDMDYNAEDANKLLTDANVYSSTRWIDLFDVRHIEDLAALNPDEITAENFPNELVMPMLANRNRGVRLFGDVTAFDIILNDNFDNADEALKSFKHAVEAAKYFVNNGGAKALEFERKMRRAAEKHFKYFDYAFSNINIDENDPTYNIRNRADYLEKVARGAAINVARFTEKKVESWWGTNKMTNFDIYQRNLGEAEARLAGERATKKLKNRAPLISELYPDVDNSEIWQLPPASFYLKVQDKKKELKEEKQRLEDLKMDFDTDLTKGLDRTDISTVEEKVSQLENAVKVFGTKLQDALSEKGKAQLIEGTFEDALFRKETQEELIRAGVDNFFQAENGVNRLFEHLRFKFADKYRPLQNLQTAIEKEKNRLERTDSNFRRAEALMHGKAAEDARQFEEKQLKPLMDKMVEYEITNEQISEYLYALHAYERNEFVKNTIDPANEAGSGMTNEVAEAIKEKYAGQKEKMDELAEMAYAITESSRKMMLDSGLITQAQYDSFKMFEHYVPLVGTAVTPTSDLFDFTDSRSAQDGSKGSGIAIFGKEYRSVTGRFSEAQSPLETIVSNHLRTISRARKNEVLQTLLNLVTENKDSRVWEVFTEENPDMRVRVSSKGTPIFIEEVTGEDYEYTLRRKMAAIAMAGNPDYVPVKVNGKTSYIKFKDSRITRVLNSGGVGKTNMFVKGLSVASRWFTKVFTSYNPEFIFANLTRDVQTAMFNQMAEQNMQLSTISGQDFVTQSFKGVPSAIQAVYQFERGNRAEMDAEMRGFYEEYLASGAKTDWFFLKTAEQVEADMLKYIRRASPITSEASLRDKARQVGEKGTATLENVGEFVDVLNTSIENGVRFSAYVAARKNGVDVDKAAEFVKELTINFNRSGEMGAVANSLYLFFNASVQGSTRMMRSLIKSKKARQVATGMTAFSALLTMMNIAVGGEDEDGIPFYDKIPDYEKERFLIIMYGNGKYGKIPLPYGINIFFNLGTSVSELMMGVSKPSEIASYMMNSVVQSFSPVSISSSDNFGYGLMKTLSPTVLKPIVELSINEDYFGNRIYKEDFYFGADTPDATRFDKNTAEWAKTMAQFLNEATGGNEYESGAVDWSPDSIEYLFTFMGGGAAKFAQRTGKAISKTAKGQAEDIEANDIPLARLFLGTVRENEAAGRYYESRQDLLKEKNKIKGALNAGKAITPEMKKINVLLGYEKQVQAEIKKLGALEKKVLKIEDIDKREKALKQIRDKKIKVYKWFNARYYALMKNETK